jgi:hypothetical protein
LPAPSALEPVAGRYAEALFAIGLLGASLLACAILPIAISYVVSESLGFEKGPGHSAGEAPVFVGLNTAMIAVATIVAVLPGIPVIGVQVVNGVLLPINLFFVWRLARPTCSSRCRCCCSCCPFSRAATSARKASSGWPGAPRSCADAPRSGWVRGAARRVRCREAAG